MKLSKAKKAEYLKHGGLNCPYCYSHGMKFSKINILMGGATGKVRCKVCRHSWIDVYKLTKIVEV
jgi:transcription elongation factor Elf1